MPRRPVPQRLHPSCQAVTLLLPVLRSRQLLVQRLRHPAQAPQLLGRCRAWQACRCRPRCCWHYCCCLKNPHLLLLLPLLLVCDVLIAALQVGWLRAAAPAAARAAAAAGGAAGASSAPVAPKAPLQVREIF